MNEDIKTFWNKCHLKKLLENLSGSTYETDIPFLKVEPFIRRGSRVLEIGVGLGYVIKELFNRGLIVSALDISEVSLKEVSIYCERTFLLTELDCIPSNYYDLVLCSNVVQHISTDTLKMELKYAIRSLKLDGVFALEFVSNDELDDTGINPTMETITNGGCCRTPDTMKRIIMECGGIGDLVFSKRVDDCGIVQGCHVIHIRRMIDAQR